VTRAAVENAASIVGIILTIKALISDKPETPGAATPAMAGMSGMSGRDYEVSNRVPSEW
jgi:hypothetical protein